MANEVYVFLSYSHRDDQRGVLTSFLQKAFETCRQNHPDCKVKPFIDQSGILAGDEWRKIITDNLEKTMLFLPCITPNYCLSEECAFEFNYFEQLMRREPNARRCIPLFWEEIDERFTQIASFNVDLLRKVRAINGVDALALLNMRTNHREKLEQLIIDDLSDNLYAAWKAVHVEPVTASDAAPTAASDAGSEREQANRYAHEAYQLLEAKKPEQSYAAARKAFDLRKGMYGIGHAATLSALHLIIYALNDEGKYAEALPLCRTLVEERGKLYDKNAPEYVDAVNWLHGLETKVNASAREQANRYADEAYQLLKAKKPEQSYIAARKAFDLRKGMYGIGHAATLSALHLIIYALNDEGKYAEALPLCRTLVEERGKLYDKNAPEYVDAVNWLHGLEAKVNR